MKKILFWTLAAMGLVMSASCSKESVSSEIGVSGPVTITASVPELSSPFRYLITGFMGSFPFARRYLGNLG